jgi:hypothetical protein
MSGRYQAILNGFDSIEQIKSFFEWFAQSGVNDLTIDMYLGGSVVCDEDHIIEHPSGLEMKIKVMGDEDVDSLMEDMFQGIYDLPYEPQPPVDEYPYAGEPYGEDDPPWGPCQ